MRPRLLLVVVLMAGVLAWTARAQDNDVNALLDRAVQAMGGVEKIEKYKAGRVKAKGKIDILGGTFDLTQEAVYQYPDKLRSNVDMDIMGQKISVVVLYNGQKGMLQVNGQKMDNDMITEMMREAAYQAQVFRLLPLRDRKAFEISTLGEIQVGGKPAVGIRVAHKGHQDVNLYFDKKSALIVKMEYRTKDEMGQEVTEEKIVTEYQTVEGMPTAKKLEINRNGKHYLDAEVIEVKHLERVDDSEFDLQ